MPEQRNDQERPCLHCTMVELIEQFFAEYPPTSGGPDTIDTDEVLTAVAMMVAELTCNQNDSVRQHIIETLMREIMKYDTDFRQDNRITAMGSAARH